MRDQGRVVAMTRQIGGGVSHANPRQLHLSRYRRFSFVEATFEKYHKHEERKGTRRTEPAPSPLDGWGKPDEIANLALYLCSSEAAFCDRIGDRHRWRLDKLLILV